MRVKKNDAFTLLEILIVVSMIALLVILAILLFNPRKQIEKAWDTKRKQDLVTIRNLFENHYNDKMYYPLSSEVCYGEVKNINGNCYCRICTSKKVDEKVLSANLCDPQSSSKDYLYQFDCNQAQPQWYRVCAILSNIYDIEASESAGTNYNYGISSSNIPPENCDPIEFGPTGTIAPTPVPTCRDNAVKYCISEGYCNICGPFEDCIKYCTQKYPLYVDPLCQDLCEY